MAERRGYFDDVGLSVEVYGPAEPTRPIPYVVTRIADVSVASQPEVVIASAKGAPITAIGSLVLAPTAAMIWLPRSGIEEIADLKGKTIAIPGLAFQEGFLRSVLAGAGLTFEDVEVKRVGYELVPSLVGGRVDAIFGGSENVEGVQLESMGLSPVANRVDELGIPGYDELVLIARNDRLAEEPETFRTFMSALAKGTDAALANPRGVVGSIWNNLEKNPEATPKVTRGQITATFPLLSRSGYINADRGEELVDWMESQGLVDQPVEASLFSNAYR